MGDSETPVIRREKASASGQQQLSQKPKCEAGGSLLGLSDEEPHAWLPRVGVATAGAWATSIVEADATDTPAEAASGALHVALPCGGGASR